MDGNYTLSDIAAVTDGNRNNGMFGGDWSAWIILFLLFGNMPVLDALCTALGLPAHRLTPQLMRLQVLRKILPLPGGRYMLVS